MADDKSQLEVEEQLVRSHQESLETVELDAQALEQRAQREVGVRDAISFGFAHMMSAMLQILARACRIAK